jgi:hypothetical protein
MFYSLNKEGISELNNTTVIGAIKVLLMQSVLSVLTGRGIIHVSLSSAASWNIPIPVQTTKSPMQTSWNTICSGKKQSHTFFDKTRTTKKTKSLTILLLLRVYSLPR